MYPKQVTLRITPEVIKESGPYNRPDHCPVAMLFKKMFPSHTICVGVVIVDVENKETHTVGRYVEKNFGFTKAMYDGVVVGDPHIVTLIYELQPY